MIIGTGIDLIETGRFQRELARASWQAEHGVFTSDEIHCIQNLRHPALFFAGCFAAKEATLKALGVEVTTLALFREIEAIPAPVGTWKLSLHGSCLSTCQKLGVRRALVAVNTSKKLSGAVVLLET